MGVLDELNGYDSKEVSKWLREFNSAAKRLTNEIEDVIIDISK